MALDVRKLAKENRELEERNRELRDRSRVLIERISALESRIERWDNTYNIPFISFEKVIDAQSHALVALTRVMEKRG